MNEIWRDVVGYENLYQTSNLGRARSLDTYRKSRNGSVKFYRGRILKPSETGKGYLCVGLCKNGKVKNFYVHRLVAEAFLPNPDNLPCVNHKDENKLNNSVENLEWCTAKYNCNFGTRNKRIIAKNTNGKCSKKVYQYTLDGEFVREWLSAKQAEREGGYNNSHIIEVCQGKRKKHHKFIWRYK